MQQGNQLEKPEEKKTPRENVKQKNTGGIDLNELEKKLKKQNNKNSKNGKKKEGVKPIPGKTGPTEGISGRATLFGLIILILLTIYTLNREKPPAQTLKVTYTKFITAVNSSEVSKAEIINNEKIRFSLDGKSCETDIPLGHPGLIDLLINKNVTVDSITEEPNKLLPFIMTFLPWLIFLGFFWFIISRQFRGKGGGAFNFGRSKARKLGESEIKETFNDVQGCDEAKEDLQEIVTFLQNPKKYIDIGAKIPKGVLLVGPPGTGKTLLAKAVAGEAKVPFFSMSGSDFVEMFVGVGASRVRDLFETGKKHAPCIVFIDELDAVGRMRGAGYGGGHDEREQTLNQMLVEMDGFNTTEAVIIMAATNRPDVLDKALLRPGRFDRVVVVDVPDVIGRLGIIKLHAKKIKVEIDVDLDSIARGTPGFTGADLANMVNEAALLAARRGHKKVTRDDFESAKDKVMMGAERKKLLINDEEKLNTAYHEAGHALVGVMLKKADVLHKVSIIPRGRALGVTTFLPEDGKHTMTQSKLEAQIRMMFGGRAAEEIILNDFTNGAANDIKMATRIARAMVCEWGMSKLGPVSLGDNEKPVFIGKEMASREEMSEDTSRMVDQEIKRIIDEAYNDALSIVRNNIDKLRVLAETLLVKESLTVDEVFTMFGMEKPRSFSQKLSGESIKVPEAPAKNEDPVNTTE